MGWRFRKSVRLMPGVRVNFGKKGASLSVGGRGLTTNVSSRGVRTTASLPGTGISYSSYQPFSKAQSPTQPQIQTHPTQQGGFTQLGQARPPNQTLRLFFVLIGVGLGIMFVVSLFKH